MNMVALSNRLASKVPHWHELEKLRQNNGNDRTLLWFMGW